MTRFTYQPSLGQRIVCLTLVPWLLRLHERAEQTPYFHLPGYMRRDWILGAWSDARNEHNEALDAIAERVPLMPDHTWKMSSRLYQWLTRHLAIRAHTILSSDRDRHLHDHPSWSLSVVLEGGYWEVLPPSAYAKENAGNYRAVLEMLDKGSDVDPSEARLYNIHWRGPGSVILRRAKDLHRLILPRGRAGGWKRCKSIFVMGKRSQVWGFQTEAGKIPYHQYLNSGKP